MKGSFILTMEGVTVSSRSPSDSSPDGASLVDGVGLGKTGVAVGSTAVAVAVGLGVGLGREVAVGAGAAASAVGGLGVGVGLDSPHAASATTSAQDSATARVMALGNSSMEDRVKKSLAPLSALCASNLPVSNPSCRYRKDSLLVIGRHVPAEEQQAKIDRAALADVS